MESDRRLGLSGLLDYGVLVSDDSLCVGNLLLCSVDDAVAGVVGEGDDEGLLGLNSKDAADGGQGQEEIRDQLHGCVVAAAWAGLVRL